jgi:predicted transcriptional regulator
MTESLTIRISRSTHGLLRELAERTGETMSEIVDRSVREFQRQRFWADYHAAYAAIQADPSAWADLQDETESWDLVSADGLERESHAEDATESDPVPG